MICTLLLYSVCTDSGNLKISPVTRLLDTFALVFVSFCCFSSLLSFADTCMMVMFILSTSNCSIGSLLVEVLEVFGHVSDCGSALISSAVILSSLDVADA